jgi:hypothetical protein
MLSTCEYLLQRINQAPSDAMLDDCVEAVRAAKKAGHITAEEVAKLVAAGKAQRELLAHAARVAKQIQENPIPCPVDPNDIPFSCALADRLFKELLIAGTASAAGQVRRKVNEHARAGEISAPQVKALLAAVEAHVRRLEGPELEPVFDANEAIGVACEALCRAILNAPNEEQVRSFYFSAWLGNFTLLEEHAIQAAHDRRHKELARAEMRSAV